MAKRLGYDRVIFVLTLILVTFGLVMVFSASAQMAAERYQSPYGFLEKQAIFAAIGLALMLLAMRLDYRRLKEPTVVYALLVATCLLLIVVLFLDRAHNTHRWIHVGPLSLQPSEMAKPALIVFLAFYLETRLKKINEWETLRPMLLLISVICGLVLAELDLGTPLALVMIGVSMLYVAGLRLRYLGMALVAALPALYLLVFHVHYRRDRILAFLHPWREAQGAAFQIVQSLIAVGTGGITGMGLMNGKQKMFFLPEPHTDFIFAVTAEELGLIGSVALVAAFMVFLWRGIRVARRAPDPFGRLLAIGVTAMVVIQALINFSVVTGLVPTKGIPLPFISYGGSSLIFTLLSVGFLLSVSQQST